LATKTWIQSQRREDKDVHNLLWNRGVMGGTAPRENTPLLFTVGVNISSRRKVGEERQIKLLKKSTVRYRWLNSSTTL